MKTVAILYGGLEGNWHGKKLRRALRENSFSITKNAAYADILIAHSAGCYTVPENGKASLVLLVGVPYWPDKKLAKSTIEKLRLELKDLWWYKKILYNTYYLFTKPHQWIRMWRGWQKMLSASPGGSTIICIRNEQDTFMHAVESEMLAKKHGWQSKVLPGGHDDIWKNPETYVAILQNALPQK